MNDFILFPAIDLRGGQCVRLRQGDYAQETVYSPHPDSIARQWELMGGRFLHLVDLDGAKAGKPVNIEAVRAICKLLSVPVEIGGGIRHADDARTWFECGVSRVIVGTAAIRNPVLVDELIARYGAESIVLGLDAKDGRVAVSGWTETSALTAVDTAKVFAVKGIKRIIFTDIATDGMMSGPNLKAMKQLCDAVPNLKIIASGGVSCVEDIRSLRRLNCPNLEGAIVGRAIYEKAAVLPEMIAVAEEVLS